VPLRRVLEASRPRLDPARKRGELAFAVVATGRDGYAVAFSLGELDPALGGVEAWLALDHDGGPLSERHAPAELLVVTDRKASRGVRGLASLRVLDLTAR
jgi:hypothetical protein